MEHPPTSVPALAVPAAGTPGRLRTSIVDRLMVRVTGQREERHQIPTRGAAPRRAQMDSQDRLWIGEYRGNRIAMFDTKTERFEEWLAPSPWSAPYDVALDKTGQAWTGSMGTDRVLRLDPKFKLVYEDKVATVFVARK